jgi:deoxyribonuclease-1
MQRLLNIVLLASLALFLTPVYASGDDLRGNTRFQSFSKAKKLLLKKIYHDRPTTFYCGCVFTANRKIVARNGYLPLRDNARANRIEFEHIVPAHAFGWSFKEWREGDPVCNTRKGQPFKGRNCARKTRPLFRYMEADMFNLVPAVGEINGLRSNYSYAIIPGEKRRFGDCDMEIEGRKAEPPKNVRGNIARIYKYMDWAYPGRGVISKKNRKLFQAWDQQDPVDDWERERARRIQALQGNTNPFIK